MLAKIDEPTLRAATVARLAGRLKSPQDVLVEELLMPDSLSRIDLALVNGHVEAFELKSDLDSLKRLPRQREHLAPYFDRLTLVCTAKHLIKGAAIVPPWWGLVEAVTTPSGIKLKHHRSPSKNPERRIVAQLSLLWREDLIGLARLMRNAPERPASMTKFELCHWIAEASPGPVFMRGVRTVLKSRVRSKLELR